MEIIGEKKLTLHQVVVAYHDTRIVHHHHRVNFPLEFQPLNVLLLHMQLHCPSEIKIEKKISINLIIFSHVSCAIAIENKI